MPLETRANQELVSTFFNEVINTHRADRAPELLSETVVDHNKIVLTEPEGPGAAEEGLRMLFTAFPDLSADVRQVVDGQVVDGGDCVAVRFELSPTPLTTATRLHRLASERSGRRSASFGSWTARSPRSGEPPTDWEC
jgi:predicted SnoaL-like aldol condensation-catalyzing enzyme